MGDTSTETLQVIFQTTADTGGAKEMASTVTQIRGELKEAAKDADTFSKSLDSADKTGNVSLRNLLQGMKATHLGSKEVSDLLKGDFNNATGIATIGLKALNAATKAGPMGLLAGAITLLIPVLMSLFTSSSNAAKGVDDVGNKADGAKPKLDGVGTAGDHAATGLGNAKLAADDLIKDLDNVAKSAQQAITALNNLEAAKLKAEQSEIKGKQVTGELTPSQAKQQEADATMQEATEKNMREKAAQEAVIEQNAGMLGNYQTEADRAKVDAAEFRRQAADAKAKAESFAVTAGQFDSQNMPSFAKDARAVEQNYRSQADKLENGVKDAQGNVTQPGAATKDADAARLQGKGAEIQKNIDAASQKLDVLDQEAKAIANNFATASAEATKEGVGEEFAKIGEASKSYWEKQKQNVDGQVAEIDQQEQALKTQISQLEGQEKALGNSPEGMRNVAAIAALKAKIIDLGDAKKALQHLLTAEQQAESSEQKMTLGQNTSEKEASMGKAWLKENPPAQPPPPRPKLYNAKGRQMIDGDAQPSKADKAAADTGSPSGTDFKSTFKVDAKLPSLNGGDGPDATLPPLGADSPSDTDWQGTFKPKKKKPAPAPFPVLGGGTNNDYDSGTPGDTGAAGAPGSSGGGDGGASGAAQTLATAAQTNSQAGTQMQTAATQFATTATGLNTGITQLMSAITSLAGTVSGMSSQITGLQNQINGIKSDAT